MPSSRSKAASPRHPPGLDAERARVKKLASYFGSLGIVPEDSSASPATDPVSSSPAAARDATLTALAQLGPLRLQCDRAFVSLTDRCHQYIIAEATRSLSYFDLARNSQDPLYLGVVALDAAWSPETIHIFTEPAGHVDICTPNVQADRSKYRMCDFRADPRYVDSPYVASWPYARAYLEVPLRTSTGEVIGSYCVVDNRIRDDWADDLAIRILAEIAQTIMDHIELVKMQEQHHRLERLVNKLCVYVEENTSMQASETNLHADQSSSASTPQDSPESSPMSGPVKSSNKFPSEKPASSSHDSLETQLTTPSPSPRLNPFESSVSPSRPTHMLSQRSSSSSHRAPPSQRSRDIPATFSRAANLIQEATDIEGLVFLDASPNGFGTRLDSKVGNVSTSLETAHSPVSAAADSPRIKMCETLGQSVSSDSISAGSLSIPEALLQRLLQVHRGGTSFFADELDELDEQEGSDAKCLFKIFDSARSILFMPLWDYQKEGWYAAAIGWSTKANRIFASEDLVYISAFGNSIMNEVSRIEAMSVSHAKSNFISSISHELRSPLHGILASTELLKQTNLDPERMALADMVEVCGVTLLETMDHLLDFAKINHLYRKGRRSSSDGLGGSRGGSRNRKDYLNLCKTADLSLLVQEVVEGAYLGHTAQTTGQFDHENTPLDDDESPSSKVDRMRRPKSKPVLLTMSIEKCNDWRLHTEPGAWRRIVLNLVGNALKYTQRGSVEVSLKCVGAESGRRPSSTEDGPEKRYICLSVKDTGRGIGEDYLKYRLFTPYAQEDSLVSGTGLGLSIVHHLVTHLDGTVHIHSEVGVGTHVQVMIPVPNDADGSPPKSDCTPDSAEEATQTLQGKTILPLRGDRSPHRDAEGEKLLSNAIHTAQSWWGMKVVSQDGPDGTETAADFCMLHVSELEAAHENSSLKDITAAIVVVCTRQPTQEQLLVAGLYNATFLQQPFGPKKMKHSLNAALSRYSHDPLPPGQPQRKSSWIGAQSRLSYRDSGAGALAIGAPVTATSTQPSTPAPSSPTPASPPSQPTSSPIPTPVTEEDRTDRPLHLLLVEDNEINLRILTTYARRLGCTFATASNGQEAVEAFKAATHPPFDVVLMDVSMPVMTGFEATRAIRAWEREKRGTGGRAEPDGNGCGGADGAKERGRGRKRRGCRILALTGLGAAESQREAFSSGMDEFLMKPVPLKRLKGVLFGDDRRGRAEEGQEKEEKSKATKA
ncbi:sensor histidine kinase response protein [Diplodia corticola]|uniref:Sensor histidine kinase response protein n=1 Tax=Diplodia corticola TaxID=236234 RepID=A0A1J9QK02_9PEZI|nr:sensor histidine kinase response protein [Diplodia corticola]OJD28816.1 sensor histidine kinase response protein [Diplodia corticola]